MRITLFLSALAGGGAQRRMLLLARGFAAAGQEVEIVTAAAPEDAEAALPAGVRYRALASPLAGLPWLRHRRGFWVPVVWKRLAAHLRTRPPDVLLATSTPANLTALLAAAVSGTGIPVVVGLNLDLEASLGRGLGGALDFPRRVAGIYRRAAMRIAISEGVAEGWRRLAGPGAPPIRTVPNPVDLAAVARGAAVEPEPGWPVPGEGPLLLACGKLKPQKDFATLLRATARLARQRPLRLVVLGEGEERRRLRALAVELGLGGRVFMPGFVANPFAWMARASLFVLSSRFEGSS
ncbi:MAG TPA: glycosyltransferase, partial [Rhodospirillales bacterium]|nr:glycosyltransferase [Rhodospirillales bacterium]